MATLIGDKLLTNAERQARWRQRHAAKLARKAARRGRQGPPTEESLRDAIPTMEDFIASFVKPDEVYHRGLMVGETPNIDRIGHEGAMFTDYYAEQSCTAGRNAFFTGMNPLRTG